MTIRVCAEWPNISIRVVSLTESSGGWLRGALEPATSAQAASAKTSRVLEVELGRGRSGEHSLWRCAQGLAFDVLPATVMRSCSRLPLETQSTVVSWPPNPYLPLKSALTVTKAA